MSLCKECLSAPSNSRSRDEIDRLEDGEICDRCGFDPAVEMRKKSRVAKVVVGREYFKPAVLFKEGHRIVDGLPHDAEFVDFRDYPLADAYVFLFKSKEFEPVDDFVQLDEIPEVTIEIDEVMME